MKLNKFLTIASFLLSIGLLSGCKDDSPEQSAGRFEPTISFTLALSSETSGTRTVTDKEGEGDKQWNSGNDPYAKGIDNKINSIRVVLYRVEDGEINAENPVGELKDLNYDKSDIDGSVVVTGTLKTSLTDTDLEIGYYRLAVFVNPSNSLDINNPSECVFYEHGTSLNINSGNINSGIIANSFTTGLPMYGVARVRFNGLRFENSTTAEQPFVLKGADGKTDLSIPILRSVAKIKVNVANNLDKSVTEGGRDMKLVSLVMSRHAKKGILVPTGWNTLDNLASASISSVMNSYSGSGLDFDYGCKITPYKGEDREKWMNSETMIRFYVPDTYNFRNDDLKTDPLQLTVYYTCDEIGADGKPVVKQNYLYFCPDNTKHGMGDHNKDGHTPWDIIRNHIYEFNITGIAASTGDLEVQMAVKKWEQHEKEVINSDEM